MIYARGRNITRQQRISIYVSKHIRIRVGEKLQKVNKLIISVLTTLGLYLLSASGAYDTLERRLTAGSGMQRMKNVTVAASTSRGQFSMPAAAPLAGFVPGGTNDGTQAQTEPSEEPDPEELSAETEEAVTGEADSVLETTIKGGMSIKNETQYWVDAGEMLADGPGLSLPSGEAQILIIHTHSSEAYTQAGLDHYEASDSNRTEDTQYNIVRIGDELTEILTDAGLNVIHDRGIYDYPSYTGSYNRSGAAVQEYLNQYPSLRIVIDLHRDALCSDSVVYKTVAELPDAACSQVMLLVGTNASGLYHPYWEENLRLAVYLQDAVNAAHPTLMRPITLVNERYNQHLTRGSLIIEVGSSGNTLQEATRAVRLFGESAGPALARLVQ